MNISYFNSIFYLLGVLSLAVSFFLYKKSDKKLTGFTWVVLIIIMLNCFHCLTAPVFDLVNLPVNLITVGLVDYAVSAVFWYQIIKKKEIQKYSFSWMDGLFAFGLICFLVVFTMVRFGGLNFNINFLVADAACHFRETMDFINTQTLNSMYYEFLNNGLFISMLGPLTTVEYYYKFFVLSEIINLGLSATVIYGICRRKTDNIFIQFMACVVSAIYVVGYPLNSAIFGFVYLGMCITVIGAIYIVVDMYLEDEINEKICIFMMMIGCLGVALGYVLFAPIVFIAVCLCIFYKQKKNGKLVSWNTIIKCLITFLIPCVLCILYTYMSIFSEDNTVSQAMTNEGGIYRNLYSNFVLFLPGIIAGYILAIKRKKPNFSSVLAPLTLTYTVILGVKVLNGTSSTYYFFKMYYLLWLIALVLVFESLVLLERQAKIVVSTFVFMWCGFCALNVLDLESKIRQKSPLMSEYDTVCWYVNVVSYNLGNILQQQAPFCDNRVEIYHFVEQELIGKEDALVPMAGEWVEDLWYQAITNQRYGGWGVGDPTEWFSYYHSSGAEYVFVNKHSSLYLIEQDFFESLDKVFENEIGFVAKYAPNPKYLTQ